MRTSREDRIVQTTTPMAAWETKSGKVSMIHTVSYSIIALQETHLNVHYPPIFWATARLLVEASSIDFMEEDLEFLKTEEEEEVEEKQEKNVNYFKMSAAMGETRSFGVKILPPDINKSTFSFRPSVEENAIYFGLKGISRIGGPIIREIIANRPYTSMEDFLSKVKVNVTQATNLIKAGAFDSLGDRTELLHNYCKNRAAVKTTLNLRNMNLLINSNLIPEDLKFYADLFRFNKYIKGFEMGGYYHLNDEDKRFLEHFLFNEIQWIDGKEVVSPALWKKFYEKNMDVIRAWIKENMTELLDKVNSSAIQAELDKYAKGNIAKHEMEALNYYYSYHELDTPEYKTWLDSLGVVQFNSLPEQPEVEQIWNGRKIFKLYRIAGTSIGRDKAKHIAGIEGTSGFFKAKFYRSQFLKYDKQIRENGRTEKSWFGKGQKLLLTGYRAGDQFIVKSYKNHKYGNPIYRFEEPRQLIATRLGEDS